MRRWVGTWERRKAGCFLITLAQSYGCKQKEPQNANLTNNLGDNEPRGDHSYLESRLELQHEKMRTDTTNKIVDIIHRGMHHLLSCIVDTFSFGHVNPISSVCTQLACLPRASRHQSTDCSVTTQDFTRKRSGIPTMHCRAESPPFRR